MAKKVGPSVTEQLRSLRERAGKSMRAIAKDLGFAGGSSYQRYEDANEMGDAEFLPLDFVRKLAPVLEGKGDPPIDLNEVMMLAGVTVDRNGTVIEAAMEPLFKAGWEALNPSGGRAEEPPSRFIADQDMARARPINYPDSKSRDLPVVGTAMGGPSGYFEMQGTIIEHVWRPPHLATVSNAFALYVAGSSMEPRYEEGELIYCRPGRRPRPRDYVVLEMHQEQDGDPIMATIGRFRRQNDHHIEIDKLNPPKTEKVVATKVRRIHIIVGTGEP